MLDAAAARTRAVQTHASAPRFHSHKLGCPAGSNSQQLRFLHRDRRCVRVHFVQGPRGGGRTSTIIEIRGEGCMPIQTGKLICGDRLPGVKQADPPLTLVYSLWRGCVPLQLLRNGGKASGCMPDQLCKGLLMIFFCHETAVLGLDKLVHKTCIHSFDTSASLSFVIRSSSARVYTTTSRI